MKRSRPTPSTRGIIRPRSHIQRIARRPGHELFYEPPPPPVLPVNYMTEAQYRQTPESLAAQEFARRHVTPEQRPRGRSGGPRFTEQELMGAADEHGRRLRNINRERDERRVARQAFRRLENYVASETDPAELDRRLNDMMYTAAIRQYPVDRSMLHFAAAAGALLDSQRVTEALEHYGTDNMRRFRNTMGFLPEEIRARQRSRNEGVMATLANFHNRGYEGADELRAQLERDMDHENPNGWIEPAIYRIHEQMAEREDLDRPPPNFRQRYNRELGIGRTPRYAVDLNLPPPPIEPIESEETSIWE